MPTRPSYDRVLCAVVSPVCGRVCEAVREMSELRATGPRSRAREEVTGWYDQGWAAMAVGWQRGIVGVASRALLTSRSSSLSA